MIPDEPVRGRVPPPWFLALPGIERYRAFTEGRMPWPPTARLLGTRTTHVAAGSVTVAMPASEALLAGNGQLVIGPLMVAALQGATHTALPAGVDCVPLRHHFDPFRPAWPRPGNLIARARVVNSGHLFVLAEVECEDADGRHIGRGTLQSAIRRVEPPPPAPPTTIAPVEEPVYETPDPYLRTYPPLAVDFEHDDGLAILEKWVDACPGTTLNAMFGLEVEAFAEGAVTLTMPASEWFCAESANVSCQVLTGLGEMSGFAAIITMHRPGMSVVALENSIRFLRPVRADGRRLRSETSLTELVPNLFQGDARVTDADGRIVALWSGSCMRLDASKRARRTRKQARRVLATLLFTDIVDSTGHAERLGDAAWRELLGRHDLTVRREISRFNGTEVDTTGDGFLVRFESPAAAIDAARAIRNATGALGIAIRAGIHTGECEIEGNRLAGMAVHIAARIQAAAEPGEVLVSSTVKDLAVGSTIGFADRGEQALKGVPDPWRLHAVQD